MNETDRQLVEEFKRHFRLKKGLVVQSVHDLLPGSSISDQEDMIREADYVLLFASANLSDRDKFLYKLGTHFHKTCIPIQLRPVDVYFLGDVQVLPRGGKPITEYRDRDSAWVELCRELSFIK